MLQTYKRSRKEAYYRHEVIFQNIAGDITKKSNIYSCSKIYIRIQTKIKN